MVLLPLLLAAAAPSFPVQVRVDAGKPLGEMVPIWRFFGADEPNYAYMKDGRRLLSELGELAPARGVYFRTHNLLNTGDGTPALKWGSTNAYTEDAAGNPVYDWTIVDRIFDTYLARGVRPYAEVGFMPEALSTNPTPYQHEWRPGLPYDRIGTGWSYPPKDYHRWAELVHAWAAHCVARYGADEVGKWWWEVWNEPNGKAYWKGSVDDFCRLNDYAVDAIRRALPNARVGGPELAGSGGAFMRAFLEHCVHGANYATGGTGTPIDFVSFHAKGTPSFVDGHVRMGIAAQLQALDAGFGEIAAFPELRRVPIVIGESDPDGCAACQGPAFGYRCTTMYSSYEAAVLARHYELADKRGVNLQGAITWAFEFEDQPYFAGQRVLAANGIDLPVLNVFRMLTWMKGQRLATTSSGELPLAAILSAGVRGAPDVGAMASGDGRGISVLLWHYHDDDVPGPSADVTVTVDHAPFDASDARSLRATAFAIDDTHSNAYAAWRRMGSPSAPNAEQYDALVAAGKLARLEGRGIARPVAAANGSFTWKVTLPRQGVVLWRVETASP